MEEKKKEVFKKDDALCTRCWGVFSKEEMDEDMCIYCIYDEEYLLEDLPMIRAKQRRYE